MNETNVEIVKNGEYNNIPLKTKYKRNGAQLVLDENNEKVVLQQGIGIGNYIILEKKFPEGKPVVGKFGTSYACTAVYKDQDVSFFLTEIEHGKFAAAGGADDKVKVSVTKGINKMSGAEYEQVNFEKIEG